MKEAQINGQTLPSFPHPAAPLFVYDHMYTLDQLSDFPPHHKPDKQRQHLSFNQQWVMSKQKKTHIESAPYLLSLSLKDDKVLE